MESLSSFNPVPILLSGISTTVSNATSANMVTQPYSSTPITTHSLGLAILRLAPLIISSGSLMCAWDQQNAFRSFLYPPLLAKPGHLSAHVVTEWFRAFATPTKWVIMLAYPFALFFAVLNVIGFGSGNDAAMELHPQTKAFYIAGGVLSVLHYYFGAWSMMWNAKISNKENIGKRNEDALRGWLGNNFMRMCWVNVPAWLCFVCATATFVRV
jgi:hypothetical protein